MIRQHRSQRRRGSRAGSAMRVPVVTVSVADLVTQLGRDPDAEAVNQALQQATAGSLCGVL